MGYERNRSGDLASRLRVQQQLAQASNIQGRVTNPPAAGLGVQLSLIK